MTTSPRRLVTPEEQSQLKTLPFAEVVTIPDAGHYPQEDTPELFLAVVKAFLAGYGCRTGHATAGGRDAPARSR